MKPDQSLEHESEEVLRKGSHMNWSVASYVNKRKSTEHETMSPTLTTLIHVTDLTPTCHIKQSEPREGEPSLPNKP